MGKISRFRDMKRKGEPIAVLTAYDAPTAKAEEAAGVDIILVGDSVGTTMLGYASERDVTLADMCHHVGAVRRGAPNTTIIADLPYRSYDTPEIAVKSSQPPDRGRSRYRQIRRAANRHRRGARAGLDRGLLSPGAGAAAS